MVDQSAQSRDQPELLHAGASQGAEPRIGGGAKIVESQTLA
jgi:hypothetical protein